MEGLAELRLYNELDMDLDRITRNPDVMGAKPCIRGMRVTVGAIVGLVASGQSKQALAYAAWRVEEIEVPLPAA